MNDNRDFESPEQSDNHPSQTGQGDEPFFEHLQQRTDDAQGVGGFPDRSMTSGAANQGAPTERFEDATDTKPTVPLPPAFGTGTPNATPSSSVPSEGGIANATVPQTDAFGSSMNAPDPSTSAAGVGPGTPSDAYQGNDGAAGQGAGGIGDLPPMPPAASNGTDGHNGEPKRQKMVVPLVSALLVGALIGGGTGAGVAVWGINQSANTSSATSSGSGQVIVNNTASVTQTTAAAAKASPSVVTISASDSSESGTGSGVVLSKDGYILTNAHVATLDGATASATITVTTSNNQILKAKLVGYDANSDLAVLKVNATNLQPATFADSNKLNVGDSVIAIGAPLGLNGSVTDGIVSALHRGITVQSSAVQGNSGGSSNGDNNEGSQSDPFQFWGFGDGSGSSQSQSTTQSVYLSVIQTDAAINPGNSGGALLNSEGQVVGINVAIATASSSSDSSTSSSGSIGVGFAIPGSFAKRIADELIANGKATHGLLGATIGDSTSSYAGAVIKDLVSGGAAQKAGLRSGDVVTAVNGSTVSNATDLTALVRQQPANEKVTVTYARDGSLHKVDVTLGKYSGN